MQLVSIMSMLALLNSTSAPQLPAHGETQQVRAPTVAIAAPTTLAGSALNSCEAWQERSSARFSGRWRKKSGFGARDTKLPSELHVTFVDCAKDTVDLRYRWGKSPFTSPGNVYKKNLKIEGGIVEWSWKGDDTENTFRFEPIVDGILGTRITKGTTVFGRTLIYTVTLKRGTLEQLD